MKKFDKIIIPEHDIKIIIITQILLQPLEHWLKKTLKYQKEF